MVDIHLMCVLVVIPPLVLLLMRIKLIWNVWHIQLFTIWCWIYPHQMFFLSFTQSVIPSFSREILAELNKYCSFLVSQLLLGLKKKKALKMLIYKAVIFGYNGCPERVDSYFVCFCLEIPFLASVWDCSAEELYSYTIDFNYKLWHHITRFNIFNSLY